MPFPDLSAYVGEPTLLKCGFNYDEVSITSMDSKYRLITVYLSEPRDKHQLMIAYIRMTEDKADWYFRKINDISEEDGVGLKQEEFDKILKETLKPKYKINPKNLVELLRNPPDL